MLTQKVGPYNDSSVCKIGSQLFVGNIRSKINPPTLQGNHITAVVSLSGGLLGLRVPLKCTTYISTDRHLWIESNNSSTYGLLEHSECTCDVIETDASSPPKDPITNRISRGEGRGQRQIETSLYVHKHQIPSWYIASSTFPTPKPSSSLI